MRVIIRLLSLRPSRALFFLILFCALCLSSCAAAKEEDINPAGPETSKNPPDASPAWPTDLDADEVSSLHSIPDGSRGPHILRSQADAATLFDRLSILTSLVDTGGENEVSRDASREDLDAGQPASVDAQVSLALDVQPLLTDAGTTLDVARDAVASTSMLSRDAGTLSDIAHLDAAALVDRVASSRVELCNGLDDDGNGMIDELFECVPGRRGSTCVTSCGVNGYRLCNSACRWDPVCQTYAEVCDDTIDNDCNGRVDCADAVCANTTGCERVPPPPPDAGTVSSDAGRLNECQELMIQLDRTRLPSCLSGWIIILYDHEGRPHESAPNGALTLSLCEQVRGQLVVSARCGSVYLTDWPGAVGRPVREGGIASLTLNGRELADGESLLCLDRWSPTPGVRPIIPLERFYEGRCP